MSLGDYVLNGGEVAVLAMVEAIGRLLPGVVGNPESLVEESHSDGLLEYPVYTKPSSWRDREVPAVLLSGNHGKIAQWRRHEQYRRTAERRPDLLADVRRREAAPRGPHGFRGPGVRRRRRPPAQRRARTPRTATPADRLSGRSRIGWNAPECGKISPCVCWVANLPQGERHQQPAPRSRQSVTEPDHKTFGGNFRALLLPGLAAVTQRE